jgi:hypothetical protein
MKQKKLGSNGKLQKDLNCYHLRVPNVQGFPWKYMVVTLNLQSVHILLTFSCLFTYS